MEPSPEGSGTDAENLGGLLGTEAEPLVHDHGLAEPRRQGLERPEDVASAGRRVRRVRGLGGRVLGRCPDRSPPVAPMDIQGHPVHVAYRGVHTAYPLPPLERPSERLLGHVLRLSRISRQ